MSQPTVLITGATGFLGQFLVPRLLESGFQVIGLSRRSAPREASSVQWIQADLSITASVMHEEVITKLSAVDLIIHAAALYELDADHDVLYQHNVLSTSNIMHLARTLPKTPHLCLISTVAVVGDYQGLYCEQHFDVGQKFSDSYASSKFAAEHMVQLAHDIPSRSIIRLGILVGASTDGFIARIDGPYYVQRLLQSIQNYRSLIHAGRFLPLPFDERSRLFLVPVDIAAQAITTILLKVQKDPRLHVYHVLGEPSGTSVRKVFASMLAFYQLNVEIIAVPERIIPNSLLKILGIPAPIKAYMNQISRFDCSVFQNDFPDFVFPDYDDYAELILRYADENLFGGPR